MKKILIVDDEVQILKALSRMFLDTDYEIISTDNSTEAKKLLADTNVDMIISDMRMPELDGYNLLNYVKEKYPKIIRIILSGYADEKPMFRALLHNVAKLYVFKPWNNNDFLTNINRLFADEKELGILKLNEKYEQLDCTSNMSENCKNMMDDIEAEDMDVLIGRIEQDPDISKLLIQVAKSAVFGVMPDKVRQAAIYIGLHNLKSFMRFACIVSSLKLSEFDEPHILCKHAYYTNRIFLFLFDAFLHKQPVESAMFAGLMHNIGLIILSKASEGSENIDQTLLTPNEYAKLEHGNDELLHQELGAHFLDQWDLPFPIYEVALYHHRPLDHNIIHQELVSCVHIAQAYAWKALGADFEPVSSKVFDRIGVSVEDFETRLGRYMK